MTKIFGFMSIILPFISYLSYLFVNLFLLSYFLWINGMFLIDFIFWSNFRFTEKVQRLPIYLLIPYMCSLPHYQHPPQIGAFVTIGEPTLTHYHQKSIVDIRVYNLCCTFYGCRQISTITD